jgi:hypothetical protein
MTPIAAIVEGTAFVITMMVMGLCVYEVLRRKASDLEGRRRAVSAAGMAFALSFLPSVIGIVTSVGLLVAAFATVGAVDPARKATWVAGGISEAINLVVLGLLVTPVPAGLALVLLVVATLRLARAHRPSDG